MFFADSKWWSWHKDREAFKKFVGDKCSIRNTGGAVEDAAVHLLRNEGPDGLSTSPTGLKTGLGSGYMAINLAVLAGARRILLVGYDNKPLGGRNHFFGEHPDKSRQPFAHWAKLYRTMLPQLKALGVEVINCTAGSAIDAFPRGSLEEEERDAGVLRNQEGAALPQ